MQCPNTPCCPYTHAHIRPLVPHPFPDETQRAFTLAVRSPAPPPAPHLPPLAPPLGPVSALIVAGSLRRSNTDGQDGETAIVVRALSESNAPKITASDMPLFQTALADIFPGVPTTAVVDDVLKEHCDVGSARGGV
jgi:hypothetical protein